MKSQKSQITENHEKEADMPINFDSLLNDLAKGNIVTVPTETVEGYAVALSSEPGIKKLMKIKDRDYNSGKIFTLVPESKKAISKYAIITSIAQNLIKHFPGELTLILPKNPDFKHFYYNHYETIGIRIPNHPLFPKIAKTIGPILLTSANPRGGTPKSITGHKPSTIIDLTKNKPKIIRQGNLKIKLDNNI
ncbi:Sua5/YciO/YrdC/YwlC family protein [Candidatus Saccharibacteria bacterium]|nr:Sua5/YciO/YrdC/YwlC family protein [Candidatus Saccharibacteria bacterium]